MPSSPVSNLAGPSTRPIVLLLDILGRRWAMRILWELRDTPCTSRALRRACGDASPGVMQTRLDELGQAGFVAKRPGGGYGLTDRGRDLLESFLPLYAFAERWGGPSQDDAHADAG